MQTRLRATIILLTLAGVVGIWLALAPFVVGYQAVGDAWLSATTHHVVTGALLVAASLVTVLTVIGTGLRALDDAVGSGRESSNVASPRG